MSDRDATADWLLSVHGRIARIAAGSLLIFIGLGIIGGFLGVLLLIIGAVPVASAAYGTLLVGPLLGRDIRGRRPSEQPDEGEEADAEDEDEPRSASDDRSDDDDDDRSATEGDRSADEEWSTPPLARAERPEGQGPRTKDIRAEGDAAGEPDPAA